MLPQATVSHQTGHRIRLHIPRCKRDREYFAKVRDELAKLKGVERIEANPNTATVLIHHRSTREEIARFAKTAELFALAVEDTRLSPDSLASRINKRAGDLNSRVVAATGGTMDLTSVSALSLAVGGVVRGLLGKAFFPSGSDMIWWAVTLLARHDARMHGAAAGRRVPTTSLREKAPRRASRTRR